MYRIDLLARRDRVVFRWYSVLLTLALSAGLVSFGIHAGGLVMLRKSDVESRGALLAGIDRVTAAKTGVDRRLDDRLAVIGVHAERILWAPLLAAVTADLPRGDILEEIEWHADKKRLVLRVEGEDAAAFRASLASDAALRERFPSVGEARRLEEGRYEIALLSNGGGR